MRRLFAVAFLFEIGFALLIVPWSAFWDRNYFAQIVPPLSTLITNNFVRGGVSGLGLINIYTALGELISMLLARRMEPETTPLRGLRGQTEE